MQQKNNRHRRDESLARAIIVTFSMAIKLSLMINDTDLNQIVKLVAHRASSEKLTKKLREIGIRLRI